MQFCVLASGSGGNATFVRTGGFGLLIDFGLGPRQIAHRLNMFGARWQDIQAVLLSHAHGDHWHPKTLEFLLERRIPLMIHHRHQATLPGMEDFHQADLLRSFDLDREFRPVPHLAIQAFCVAHDDGLTCGFRLEGSAGPGGGGVRLGFATDLGSWNQALAEQLLDVDLLAVEFNHDVHLQRTSGRPAFLVRRILGDQGHLSNDQAARLVREVVERSEPGRVRHVVQLHLSRDCNRPHLARQAALKALAGLVRPPEIHTASQEEAGPWLDLTETAGARPVDASVAAIQQPFFPGWDEA